MADSKEQMLVHNCDHMIPRKQKICDILRNERHLVQLLAHLVGLGHHGHQFDVVVEDGQQAGVSQTGPGTGLTYTQTHT